MNLDLDARKALLDHYGSVMKSLAGDQTTSTARMTFSKAILTIAGVVFVALALFLPLLLWFMREHGGQGLSVIFTPGYESLKEALGSAITNISVVSSIVVAVAILPFEHQRSRTSIFLGILTLIITSVTIMYSLFLSLIRPLTGTAPTLLQVYSLVGLLPLSLGLMMLTIAFALTGHSKSIKK